MAFRAAFLRCPCAPGVFGEKDRAFTANDPALFVIDEAGMHQFFLGAGFLLRPGLSAIFGVKDAAFGADDPAFFLAGKSQAIQFG